MNTRSNLLRCTLTLFALVFLMPLIVHAQTTAASVVATPTSLPDSIVGWLTPILVPLLIALVKQIGPKIPSWVLPLIAPVLGLVIGLINNAVASHHDNLWVAAGLGLLGVAVREVKETVVKAENGGWPAETPPAG